MAEILHRSESLLPLLSRGLKPQSLEACARGARFRPSTVVVVVVVLAVPVVILRIVAGSNSHSSRSSVGAVAEWQWQ